MQRARFTATPLFSKRGCCWLRYKRFYLNNFTGIPDRCATVSLEIVSVSSRRKIVVQSESLLSIQMQEKFEFFSITLSIKRYNDIMRDLFKWKNDCDE